MLGETIAMIRVGRSGHGAARASKLSCYEIAQGYPPDLVSTMWNICGPMGVTKGQLMLAAGLSHTRNPLPPLARHAACTPKAEKKPTMSFILEYWAAERGALPPPVPEVT